MENKEDRFLVFLDTAEKSCKTKQDLAKKIDNEINNVTKVRSSPTTPQSDGYVKDLNDLKFCMDSQSFREPTPYRKHILDVLDSLR